MKMPPLGFGCCSPFRSGGRRVDLEAAVRTAVQLGYCLFDVAELYGNERAVGRALRSAELFVVGKAWRTNFRPEALWQACEASLRRLGREAFDLYLLHAPEAWRHDGPLNDPEEAPEEAGWEELERRALPRDAQGDPALDDVPLAETWEAMGELARRGLAGAVGVSNFAPAQIEALTASGGELPAANQIAVSPAEPNNGTVAWCRERGIRLMAHSPLSALSALSRLKLTELAERHRRTPAQIVLRWHVQRGLVPLPSSTDPAHIAENLEALRFTLDDAAMAAVDSLAGSA